MILNVDFALNLSNYTSLKRLICLNKLNNMSQFNGHTLPVTPFEKHYMLDSQRYPLDLN